VRYKRFATLLVTAASIHAGTIVVPSQYENQVGYAGTNIFRQQYVRFQQIFPSASFPGPLPLSGLAFRPFPSSTRVINFSLDMQIDLSITSVTPGTMSTAFAANLGTSSTTVFTGSKNVSISGAVNPDGTTPFEFSFPFSSNFAYEPGLGNLLLDLRIGANPSTVNVPTIDVFFDAPYIPYKLYGTSSQPTGTVDVFELITQFTVVNTAAPEPVPEPATIGLTFFVLAILPLIRRRELRRQEKRA
jgi:hypothetical protein